MSIRHTYMATDGCSSIKSITFREGFQQASGQADIICSSTSLTVGSSVNVSFGYTDDNQVQITNGVVKKVIYRRPDNLYQVQVNDILSRAMDFFVVSDDPHAPLSYINKTVEFVVGDLLDRSGITSHVTSGSFNITVGTQAGNPYTVNMESAWTEIENINRIVAGITYAEQDGVVHFTDRKPYPTGGDVSVHQFSTGNTGDITAIEYIRSEEITRNRVVVYGSPGISAVTSGSSSVLPAGFYKTLLISHPIIDSVASANLTAAYNLSFFNRPDYKVQLDTIGNSTLRSRAVVTVNEPFAGIDPETLWVIFASTHNIDRAGYKCSFTLVR